MTKSPASRKDRRVEFRVEEQTFNRAVRVCEAKGITLSHIARKGFEWALALVERDPNVGAPEEMSRRGPRPDLRAWEPSTRPVRSRDPF
jgi:hypothetical protein